YQHELPNFPGKSIKGVLVEYGSAGYSPGPTRGKSAFNYDTVREGGIRSQIKDGPGRTSKAGPGFSGVPPDRHQREANASETQLAKLLVVFVVDTSEKELMFPLEKCGPLEK